MRSIPTQLEATLPPYPHRRVALISVHGDPLVPVGAEEAGGQNVYVREVARALVARGCAVDVFTRGRSCVEPEVSLLDGARVVRLPAGPRGFIPRTRLYEHLPAFVAAFRRFVRQERRTYDAVHTNYWLSGWVGLQVAEGLGVPHLHTHHSLGAWKYQTVGFAQESARVRLAVENSLLSRCDAIVATSPHEIDALYRFYAARPHAVLVPCGIDARAFRPQDPAAARRALGLPEEGALLAYAGRFDPQKGIDTFVQAAARLKERFDVRLAFAGGFDPAASDRAEFERIRALTEALGLAERSHFLGLVPRERLAAFFSAADAVAVPSHYESFGLVAIEAMACGTPVVASDVGGLRYSVIHRETGLLAPARDERAFADALGLLLEAPELRRSMGRTAAEHVASAFTWDVVAERLDALYGSLRARRRARAEEPA